MSTIICAEHINCQKQCSSGCLWLVSMQTQKQVYYTELVEGEKRKKEGSKEETAKMMAKRGMTAFSLLC